MARRALKKTEQGRTKCVKTTGGMKICVEGKKFGFIGRLIGKSGRSSLPLVTGKARTAETAIKNARAFLKKTRRR